MTSGHGERWWQRRCAYGKPINKLVSILCSGVSLTVRRIACWVFLADGFLTVCFKNHPALSVFEMDCHVPWSAKLWEAENASSFNKIVTAHSTDMPLPPLKDVVTQLLETPSNAPPIPWSLSLSAEHLLILIYGKLFIGVYTYENRH